jgi:hypothetical protein
VRLDELDERQRAMLRDLFHTLLSEAGTRKVDAIIATEAALGMIEGSPEYRDPAGYWTAVFGEPGPQPWGLRCEGHHLSVNMTFRGAAIVSATPLFLGANPQRIPSGPDEGLRALAAEVDLAWTLYESLDERQREVAPGTEVAVIHQRIIDGWRTYRENPGDSGQRIAIDWTLPEGVTAGALRYPVPEPIRVGPLMNHGYSRG